MTGLRQNASHQYAAMEMIMVVQCLLLLGIPLHRYWDLHQLHGLRCRGELMSWYMQRQQWTDTRRFVRCGAQMWKPRRASQRWLRTQVP